MIKEAYRAGYYEAFAKLAAPRWVKALQNSELGGDSLSKLKLLKLKEREIKPLGDGTAQVADLVHHPEYGMAVRKIPAGNGILTDDIGMETIQNWKDLKEKLQGKGPFAHILGNKGPIGYYERAIPSRRRKILSETERQGQAMVKEHYPKAHDFSDANFVGDKYVDFQFGNEAPLPEGLWAYDGMFTTKAVRDKSKAYQYLNKGRKA